VATTRGDGPAIDVAAERALTPGCATVVHLNNAGASLPTAATLAAVTDHLALEARHGGYEAAALVEDRLVGVRRSAAALMGAHPDEVVLTGSDTQAWTKAVWSFVLGGNLGAGQRILTDRITYDSHYFALSQIAGVAGATVGVVPSVGEGTDGGEGAGRAGGGGGSGDAPVGGGGGEGEIDVDALVAELAVGEVALCTVTHVPTHRGLVNPVAACGRACTAAGVPYFVDLCQSLGQLPVDVRTIGCQVATSTGRKWLRGPRGTGLLFVDTTFAERLTPFGLGSASATWDDPDRPDRYGIRPGTARFAEFEGSVALQLGLGAAIDHVLELGIVPIAGRVGALAEQLRTGLAELGDLGVRVWDGGRERCGIVTFTVGAVPPAQMVAAASQGGININWSESSAALFDMRAPRPSAVVRASPHYFNTEDDLGRLLEVVGRVARAAGSPGSAGSAGSAGTGA
jgi:selenocysteine lyase/cysteine desulfurase